MEVAVELGDGGGRFDQDSEFHVVIDGRIGEIGGRDEGTAGVGGDTLGVQAGGEGMYSSPGRE